MWFGPVVNGWGLLNAGRIKEGRTVDVLWQSYASLRDNGKKGVKGTCPTCGTGMFRILGKA